ncbi:hypothetical protein AT05_00875 [Schleiferia thermophila str. Yellowstone]|jgi:hypothetical protein|nr:hypothetical protein AT05_00875 [Schleiferia thermophila str. Yellowstone]
MNDSANTFGLTAYHSEKSFFIGKFNYTIHKNFRKTTYLFVF